MRLSNAQVRALRMTANGHWTDQVNANTAISLCRAGLFESRTVSWSRQVRNGGFGADYYQRTEYTSEYRITASGAEELALWEQANNTDADGHPIA